MVYWEYYGNMYLPNRFIIIDVKDNLAGGNIQYSGLTENFVASSIDSLSYGIIPSTKVAVGKYEGRLVSTSELTDILNHKYATTKSTSPVYTMQGNQLLVYYNDDFYISEVYLNYIRKPKLIDYITNRMPEIKNIGNLLVQRTVQNIKAKIKDDNYNLITNENNLNKII
jgi:hypothetical protein